MDTSCSPFSMSWKGNNVQFSVCFCMQLFSLYHSQYHYKLHGFENCFMHTSHCNNNNITKRHLKLCVAVMWTVAVWIEGENELEGVVPSCWIEGKTLRWPRKNCSALYKQQEPPADSWQTFALVKVKFTSGNNKNP